MYVCMYKYAFIYTKNIFFSIETNRLKLFLKEKMASFLFSISLREQAWSLDDLFVLELNRKFPLSTCDVIKVCHIEHTKIALSKRFRVVYLWGNFMSMRFSGSLLVNISIIMRIKWNNVNWVLVNSPCALLKTFPTNDVDFGKWLGS